MGNLPPGTTQWMIDRHYGDDEPEYEPDDAELEDVYLDQLEQEAEQLPTPVFYETWVPFEMPAMRKPAGVQLNLFEEREAA